MKKLKRKDYKSDVEYGRALFAQAGGSARSAAKTAANKKKSIAYWRGVKAGRNGGGK